MILIVDVDYVNEVSSYHAKTYYDIVEVRRYQAIFDLRHNGLGHKLHNFIRFRITVFLYVSG